MRESYFRQRLHDWDAAAAKYQSHQKIARYYKMEAAGRLRPCKDLAPNLTKMFHVKHFLNNSKLRPAIRLWVFL